MRIRRLPSIPALGWPAWLATVAAFALLCAVVAYWALALLAPRPAIAPSAAGSDAQTLPELRMAAQLFGVTAGARAEEPPPSNIVLHGILAAGARGSAILSVDGKPPKAYAVGERISDTQRVHAVRPDRVVVDAGGMRTDLPAPLRRDTSVLTSGARASGASGDAPPVAFGAPASTGGGEESGNMFAMPVPRTPPPPPPRPAPPPSQVQLQPLQPQPQVQVQPQVQAQPQLQQPQGVPVPQAPGQAAGVAR